MVCSDHLRPAEAKLLLNTPFMASWSITSVTDVYLLEEKPVKKSHLCYISCACERLDWRRKAQKRL